MPEGQASLMTAKGASTTEERLKLRSRISELSRAYAWVERLALQHAIPHATQFAMNLCLEEVLSNIIRHGYRGQPARSIKVLFTNPAAGYFVFVVEDEAPPFNPLDVPEPPPIKSVKELPVGGRGISLLRHFAQTLEYQATPAGNRLSFGFHIDGSAVTKD
jgi:serine/threonine-protein kinase RsbW